jgi:hypothetical protein
LQHAPGVKNGRVLVIGSEDPWVEACVLEAGAKEIVTLEYGEIKSKHPQIKTMTPLQFRKSYLSDTLGTFDAIVTFSSVEIAHQMFRYDLWSVRKSMSPVDESVFKKCWTVYLCCHMIKIWPWRAIT